MAKVTEAFDKEGFCFSVKKLPALRDLVDQIIAVSDAENPDDEAE
jgi:hypothetical protein